MWKFDVGLEGSFKPLFLSALKHVFVAKTYKMLLENEHGRRNKKRRKHGCKKNDWDEDSNEDCKDCNKDCNTYAPFHLFLLNEGCIVVWRTTLARSIHL